jgi:hypothetical protein
MPSIDHGLDEDEIWSFQKSAFNQIVIKNDYLINPWSAATRSNIPKWGEKFFAPSFFREEKIDKLLK